MQNPRPVDNSTTRLDASIAADLELLAEVEAQLAALKHKRAKLLDRIKENTVIKASLAPPVIPKTQPSRRRSVKSDASTKYRPTGSPKQDPTPADFVIATRNDTGSKRDFEAYWHEHMYPVTFEAYSVAYKAKKSHTPAEEFAYDYYYHFHKLYYHSVKTGHYSIRSDRVLSPGQLKFFPTSAVDLVKLAKSICDK